MTRSLYRFGLWSALAALAPEMAWAADSLFTEFTLPVLAFIIGGAAVYGYLTWLDPLEQSGGRADERFAPYEMLLAAPFSAFYCKNLHQQREWFSEPLLKLLGIPAKRASFKAFSELMPEKDFELLRQAVVDLKAGENEICVEVELLSGFPLQCSGKIVDHAGERYLLLWWRDASRMKAKAEQLRKENERVKRETRQLNDLLNALPVPIWMRDMSFTIRFCNVAYMEACDEKDAAGPEALELYGHGRALAEKAAQQKREMRERRHIILRGERKLHDIIEAPWEEGEGNLSGIALDMSEIDRLQQELERTRSAQSDLMESTTSAMAIYGADRRLQFYNQAFVTLWKLEEPWLATHPTYSDVLEKLRDNRSLPEQANFPAFKQQHLKLFSDLLEPNEEFFYLPDGRTLRVLAIPHAFGGVLFAYEDVTDRLALERSYNTLIAVQRETLDHLHEGVAVFGEDGRLRLSNPTYMSMWNLTPEIVQSQPHIGDLLDRQKRLFYFESWNDFKAAFQANMQRREANHAQLERRDGKVLDIVSVPLPDGQTLLTFVDITDSTLVERSLRERNEALQEADRVKSEFLANISYELRSPLTSISGFAEMLRQDYFGKLSDQQRDYVGSIYEASRHLMSLIDDILDIASIEAGYLKLDIGAFDLFQMLAAMQTLVAGRAREAEITLTLECDPKFGAIEADEHRLRQVLFNLLANAVKYTGRGGQVSFGAEVRYGAPGEMVMLWVEDDGIGIPPEEQEAVFGKFYRSAAAKRLSSGTGLGLSMVKSFIELHGGEVRMISEPGKGTRVECFLPRKAAK